MKVAMNSLNQYPDAKYLIQVEIERIKFKLNMVFTRFVET